MTKKSLVEGTVLNDEIEQLTMLIKHMESGRFTKLDGITSYTLVDGAIIATIVEALKSRRVMLKQQFESL